MCVMYSREEIPRSVENSLIKNRILCRQFMLVGSQSYFTIPIFIINKIRLATVHLLKTYHRILLVSLTSMHKLIPPSSLFSFLYSDVMISK